MTHARSFCVALRDITAGQPRRWASLGEVIARLGVDRREAGQLVARLSRQGMIELAEGDRLRLTEKGRRATGASGIRRLGFRTGWEMMRAKVERQPLAGEVKPKPSLKRGRKN